MEKEIIEYTAERAKILATTPAAKQETAAAAQAWLDAMAAAADDAAIEAATTELLDYLDGRPHSIDGTIAFASGPAKEMMGEEIAAQMLADALAAKEAGVKYCTCDACTAASQILAKHGRIEL